MPKAFNKVKSTFRVSGYHLEIVTEERYDDVIDHVANQFMPDETLCRAFGVVWNPDSEAKLTSILKENLSIMAVDDDTDDVIGIRVSGVVKHGEDLDISSLSNENVRAMCTFLCQKDREIDFYNRYHVSEQFHYVALGVHRNYRNRGLGSTLVGISLAFAKQLGFKAIKGEGTSEFSQTIYEKHGFQTVAVLPYNRYQYKDGYLSERTDKQTCTKIYVLLF